MSSSIKTLSPSLAVVPVISRAVTFLAQSQLAHGEIPVHRFSDSAMTGTGAFDSTPFATGLALIALKQLEHPLVAEIRRKATSFLYEQYEPPGVWRYWSSRQGTPIDPDVDDTCCISYALNGRAHSRVASASACDNVALILRNRHASGLFKTWLRDNSADNDVDGVVNANVLLYLGERPETLPARDIIIAAINQDREAQASIYYPNASALYHAVARAYVNGVAGFSLCKDAVLRKLDSTCLDNDPIALASAIFTRVSFGDLARPLVVHVARLFALQQADGGFAKAAFYTGPEPPAPRSVWWGSRALSTTLCVEALAAFFNSKAADAVG